MAGLFESDSYMIRQKVLKLLGEEFHIYSDNSMKNMIGYSKQKALKLKEDIRVYSDEQKTVELLRIKQSGMLDFKGNFEIIDGPSGQNIASIKRKALMSIGKDSYKVIDTKGREVGEITEDSLGLALVRRFVPFATYLIPQKFVMKVGGAPGKVVYSQTFNPLVHKLMVSGVGSSGIDPRIAAAGAILLIAIEGKQSQAG